MYQDGAENSFQISITISGFSTGLNERHSKKLHMNDFSDSNSTAEKEHSRFRTMDESLLPEIVLNFPVPAFDKTPSLSVGMVKV